LTAACGRWLYRRAEREKKCQNRRGEGGGNKSQGRTHPPGHAELAFFSDYAAGRGVMNMGSRGDAQEQQAEKAHKGYRRSPRRTVQRSLHKIGAQA